VTEPALPAPFTSRTIDVRGPLHFLEGGSGPPLVLVHGLGGSHVNWLAVAPRLAERRRVYVPDLAGFGRTPPGGRGFSVEENARLLADFLAAVVKEPAPIVGNSMGGLISILLAANDPAAVTDLVLVDPSQPRPLLSMFDPLLAGRFALSTLPFLGEWAMARRASRLGAEGTVRDILGLCCVNVERIPRDVFLAHVAIARERMDRMPWSNDAFVEALRSIFGIVLRAGHFRSIVGRIRARALVVHGKEDRLVPVEGSRELVKQRPDWKLVELDDIGHVPQLECPERFLEIVTPWLEAVPARV
jgi:pimeloyl-ACP methyl ester carboxylesterase